MSIGKGIKIIVNNLPDALKASQKAGTVLNLKTGKQEVLNFLNFNSDSVELLKKRHGEIFDAYNENFTDTLGKVQIKLGEFAGMRLNAAPSTYFGEKSLYIDFLATKSGYKGIGTEILRKLVKLSEKLGFKGNVDLFASTGSIPSSFAEICGVSKCQKSAAISYRKMGFSFGDEAKDLKLDEEIARGGNGLKEIITASGKIQQKDLFSGAMYLEERAIEKYLNN